MREGREERERPLSIEGADPELYNDDLAPTTEAQRTWRWTSIAALMISGIKGVSKMTHP